MRLLDAAAAFLTCPARLYTRIGTEVRRVVRCGEEEGSLHQRCVEVHRYRHGKQLARERKSISANHRELSVLVGGFMRLMISPAPERVCQHSSTALAGHGSNDLETKEEWTIQWLV